MLASLDARGLVYACDCSRRTIAEAVGAEHDGAELRYPGTCRDRDVDPNAVPARRVRLAPTTIHFDDLILGPQSQEPAAQCGDVLVRDRSKNWTYQFAVSVDDVDQEIDVIIRGQDLLASTGRQIQLAQLMGRVTLPVYAHHTLLHNPDGSKLSKSTQATGLRELRAAGWSAARVLGEAAYRAGLQGTARSLTATDLAALFG